ncbi:MAG TPA: type IV pilus assembly protein PilM [Thermodesulfobacteriota bacterium]
MFLGKKEVVGLDIGSNSIKLAELKETKKGYQLKNIGETLLPPEAIVNKVITNRDAVSEAIYSLIEELRVKTKNAVISISGHSVIIKKVSIPKMSEKELREAVPWELEQYIPQNIEDVNYDFQILPGQTPEGNMDVLIVAAKKDITNDYINVVNDAGLNPVVVDVDVFALENMYEANYPESGGVVALVNIGASVTNINILKNGVSVFTRDITTGGNQFTELIQKEFDVGYDEAEKMKNSLGRPDVSPELDRISQDFTDLICGEIKRTLDFFSTTLWREKVDKIMLGGGTSKVPRLREVLEDIANAPVELINPFRNILYNPNDFDPEYISDIAPKMGVTVGLALRKMGDKT